MIAQLGSSLGLPRLNMDLDRAVEEWKLYLSRRGWEQVRAAAEADGDTAGVAAADQALRDLHAISALDALRANAGLVSMLSVQRWIAMKEAREQGATLEEIGKALGVSRQAAWEVFHRKIAEQQGHGSNHDVGADRSTVDRGSEG
jgi:hypothetical protein